MADANRSCALRSALEEIKRRFPRALNLPPDVSQSKPALDDILKGLIPPETIIGLRGRGATSLLYLLMARITGKDRALCAYVDGDGVFFPPAAAARGVDLSSVFWIHCPDINRALRAAELLLSSNAFALVALDPPSSPGPSLHRVLCRRLSLNVHKEGGRLLVLEKGFSLPLLRYDRRLSVRPADYSFSGFGPNVSGLLVNGLHPGAFEQGTTFISLKAISGAGGNR